MRFERALIVTLAAACGFQVPGAANQGDAGGGAPPGDGSSGSGSDAGPGSDAGSGSGTAPDGGPTVVCPASYTLSLGSSRYRVGTGSWYAAQQACVADGTHLVVINNAGENAFVRTLSLNPIWLGMSDHVAEGSFVWVTGAMVTGFQVWALGQPDNKDGAEDCGEMIAFGAWNDARCTIPQTYVCECDGAPPPAQATWCQTGIDTSCDDCDMDCTVDEGVCSQGQRCIDAD